MTLSRVHITNPPTKKTCTMTVRASRVNVLFLSSTCRLAHRRGAARARRIYAVQRAKSITIAIRTTSTHLQRIFCDIFQQ